MKKNAITLFLLIFSTSLFAQSLRPVNIIINSKISSGSGDQPGNTSIKEKMRAQTLRNWSEIAKLREKGITTTYPASTTSITRVNAGMTLDYVLFRDVVRKYTWLEGLGNPITQEEANHLPYYFRLSMKNDAGHYQLVEAMHGNSLTTSHPLSTYILDKENDMDENNHKWREKLLTVGQWLFYSDLTGEYVLEERAYEAKVKDAKLVYSMQPVQNDSNHITIAYTDSLGFPADMNENDRFTYGSVVYITYDENGYDAVIDYLDGAGYRKTNTNGVDQTRCEYDEIGRPLLRTSNNCVGDYAIDNWGNCGIRYTYDDKNNTYSMLCVDNNLHPMRMPDTRANAEDTYIRCDVKKDRWGRKIEAIMLTADGKKDATKNGIHRITYTYKADGTPQSKHYFDINGKELTIK